MADNRFADYVLNAPHMGITEKASMVENALGTPGSPGWHKNLAEYVLFKAELEEKTQTILKLSTTAGVTHEGDFNKLKAEAEDLSSPAKTPELRSRLAAIGIHMVADAEKLEKGGESARYYSGVYDMLAGIEGKFQGNEIMKIQKDQSRASWRALLDAASTYPSRKTSLLSMAPIYAASIAPVFKAREEYAAQQAFNHVTRKFTKGQGHVIDAPQPATFKRKNRPATPA